MRRTVMMVSKSVNPDPRRDAAKDPWALEMAGVMIRVRAATLLLQPSGA